MAKRSRTGRRSAALGADTPADEVISTPEQPDTLNQDTPDTAVDVTRRARPAPETIELPVTPTTRELFTAEPPAASATQPDAIAPAPGDVGYDVAGEEEFDAGATREAAIVSPTALTPAASEPPLSATLLDADATIVRERPAPETGIGESAPDAPPATRDTPPSRPRFNTLAGAFNRARPTGPLDEPDLPALEELEDPADEVADEVDAETEWAFADQETVHLSQDELNALRPSFPRTDEQPMPPSRAPEAAAPHSQPRGVTPPPPSESPTPNAAGSVLDWRAELPPRPKPPFPLHGANLATPPDERLAAPDGRHPHTALPDGPPADYRMERFQELRRHRVAHEHGEEATDDITPVADAVRQWWRDLRPGVGKALEYQREARESGSHPLPAYAPPPPTSRLGDAFGKLAASAREVAGPTWKVIHDRVEHVAQGLIQKIEGDATRQQAPFLGPGRVAIFFRRGVTVGQAQRLLAASSARPMRLIPRKHGILAQVMPGRESEVGEKLRLHPYVDDVVYMDYDDRG